MSTTDKLRSAAAGIATARKPTRKQALELMEQLLQGVEHDDSMEAHGLAITKLYAYFMPSLPKRPKTAYGWVSRAAAKKDVREYLQFVYSDGTDLVASDGHRLHVLYGAGMPVGYYAPGDGELEPVELSHPYPDWRRVVPSTDSLSEGVSTDDWQQWPMREIKKDTIAVQVSEQTWVNRDYLQDALYGFLDPVVYTQDDPNGSVVVAGRHEPINSLTRLAVIMPVRM